MDAKVTLQSGMKFLGVADSGNEIPLDAGEHQGGAGEGSSPMELLAIGVAGCTAMDVISILRKKKQDVSGFEVKVHVDRSEQHPKVFTKMLIEYVVTGKNLEAKAVERSVELSETKYCSGIAMLSKAAPIQSKITLIEEN
jgi:putative redox protein